ncbi:MAG: hypothetical protein EHM33_00725 [Chloroflexi bacterium]|nr:MAG: hypothetical protein EHM33_00725 [Chloroflexota bacterium]
MLTRISSISVAPRLKLIFENNVLQNSLIFGFAVVIGMLTVIVIPGGGSDVRDAFLPSLHQWRSPWLEANIMLPWSTLVLMPLRLFSPIVATIIINVVSVLMTALTLKRLGGNILLTVPILVSPIGYWMFTTGQIDALVLGGFLLLPAGYDLLFFWKPQVVLHALWARVLRSPKIYFMAGFFLISFSFVIWGNWPQAIFNAAYLSVTNGWWNRSLWPYSIPIGLVFVYLSIKKKDESYGIMASPLLSPYVNGSSYIGLVTVVAAKWPKVFLLLYIAFWLYAFYKT